MANLLSYPIISTVASGDLLPITDISTTGKPLRNISVATLTGFITTSIGAATGTGTTNKLPLWTNGPSGVLGDSMAAQDSTAVTSIFEINAIKGSNEYSAPTGSTVYKLKSGNANKLSITQDGGGGVVLGNGDIVERGPAFNLGGQSFANGENAIAIGAANTAFGKGSLAVNFLTLASGGGASAFGLLTEASGLASASFGNKTAASGAYSIASGQDSIASGQSAVAIGEKGNATGKNSFVQGFGGSATANNAAKFGYDGSASGANSVKFGFESVASGDSAFASGWKTLASGDKSTAMGSLTTASGDYSTAGGSGAQALGDHAVAFGKDNIAGVTNNTFNDFAGGINSSAIGGSSNTSSFAYGNNATAMGQDSAVFGKDTTAIPGANRAFVCGLDNTVTGQQSFSSGQSNTVNGNNSVAFGLQNSTAGNGALVGGFSNTNAGTGSIIQGTQNNGSSVNRQYMFGTSLLGVQSDTMIVGKFNANPSSTSAFVVGVGASAGARKNSIEVQENGYIKLPQLQASASYANDAAAAAGGVPVGALYRNGSIVQIRIT